MTISNSFLDYEIPSTFQYQVRRQTLSDKIYNIGKKILIFFHKNQVAIAISLSSFLISKTIASSLDDLSSLSIAMDNLKDCQDKICEYWKQNIAMQQESIISKINSLSDINFRCNISDLNYRPYTNLNKCTKDLCKYASENSKECFDSSRKFLKLWNRFCPKLEFNELRNQQKFHFFQECFKKICDYYNTHNEKSNFHVFCAPIKIQTSMEELLELLKNLKHEEKKSESGRISLEASIGIIGGVVGLVTGGVNAVGSIYAYRSGKISLEISEALPRVSEGLTELAGTTIECARRMSILPTERRISTQISSQIEHISEQIGNVYYDANSHLSIADSDVREFSVSFGEESEESLGELNLEFSQASEEFFFPNQENPLKQVSLDMINVAQYLQMLTNKSLSNESEEIFEAIPYVPAPDESEETFYQSLLKFWRRQAKILNP